RFSTTSTSTRRLPISTGKALSNSTATGPPARATRSRTTCSRPKASARSWSPHCATWTPSPRSTVPGISPSAISFSTGARPGHPLRSRCSPIMGGRLRRPAGAAAGRSRRRGRLAKELNRMRGEADPRGQPAARASRRSQEGTGTTTRPARWDQLRRYLWQPPRPHGEQPAERVVGPLELFYDLAVVVLVAQSAHHLAGHLTWRGFGEFAVVFTLVWIAWTNGSLHHELHGHDDARARSTFLLQILVLVAMGAFIPEAGAARGAAFAVAAGVLFAILAVLWLLAARGDRPEYRRSSRLFVAGTAACAVLLAVTALLPAGARVPAWGLLDAAYLAGFAAVILAASPAPAAALFVTDALIERFGLLTIIVLGETLTGVVGGLAAEPASGLTLAVGLVAVVVGFGAWWTYFDFAGHRPPR